MASQHTQPARDPRGVPPDGTINSSSARHTSPAESLDDRPAGQELSLVIAAMRGDHEALQRVWVDSRRWVAAILLAHKPRDASLDDLLQTVALQLCRKIDQVREPEAFRPWLRTVAINAARAHARRHQANPALRLATHDAHSDASSESAARAPTPSPAAAVAQGDDARRLMDLARTLPEHYREPLLLRCARGLSYRQIGAVLDLPETTIETRIARGRRMLRELAEQPTAAASSGSSSTAAAPHSPSQASIHAAARPGSPRPSEPAS